MRKKTKMMKRFSSIICMILCLSLTVLPCLFAVGCSSGNLGTPLMTLDGNEFTENMFRLLMSRVKGNLSAQGYTVTADSLWNTVALSDGTRYDEYTRQLTLLDAKEKLAASVMFDDLGLTLSSSVVDDVDAELDSMVQSAGSENALNATLSEYGANVDILRALYIMEAKYSALLTYLYGADGSLISDNVKQEYLENNVVCFRQLMLRSYAYVYEKDSNGDDIWYIASENNGQVSNIAYDKVNGSTRTSEYGKTIIDANGDDVYFTSTGRIAYDTVNGIRAYSYDADGNPQTVNLSAEQIAENRETALEVCGQAQSGGAAVFEALLSEFAAADKDLYIADNTDCFLYTDGTNSYDYLNDMADELADMNVGDARVVTTEYGCHVLMKYAVPADAASDSTYDEWFTDLVSRVIEQLFSAEIAPYIEKIQVDSDVYAALPSMKEIGVNYYY